MSGYQVGDVVVCVDDRPSPRIGHNGNLRRGSYYRIAGIREGEAPHSLFGKTPMDFWFDGMHSGSKFGTYSSVRFRKLDAPKTEIADRIRACKPRRVDA